MAPLGIRPLTARILWGASRIVPGALPERGSATCIREERGTMLERVRPHNFQKPPSEGKKAVRPEKKPSALKHGAFSAKAVLPGEDPAEFDALLQSLLEEWQPEGALEEETVRTLASYLWRKNRLD